MQIQSWVLLLLALQLHAAPAGRFSIEGQVVALGTGKPVPRARILVARQGGAVQDYRTAVASEYGRFSVNGLSAGSYRVYAERHGYLRGEHGRRTADVPGLPVSLVEGQSAASVTIVMVQTGIIAGRVLEEGRPARNVWVRAMKPAYFNGERSLVIAKYVRSDDLGEYRLYNLAPGTYFVSALAFSRPRIDGDTYVVPLIPSNANENRRESRMPGAEALRREEIDADALENVQDVPSFYGATTDETAAVPIEVDEGVTVAGIDVPVARVRAFRVRGRVVDDATGMPAEGASVTIFSPSQRSLTLPGAPVSGGTFELAAVPSGRYEVVGRINTSNPLFGTAIVEVSDHDVEDVAIVLRRGTPLKGRVTVDSGRGDVSQISSLQLTGVNGFGYSVLRGPGGSDRRLQSDGTFMIANVEPREYRIQVRGPGARLVPPSSILFGGEDITTRTLRVGPDSGEVVLEIDVSLATGGLEVTVVDERQQPVPGATVALVPDPPRRNQSALYRSFTTDAVGRFQSTDVIPGDYKLFVTDVDPAVWQDPDVVRQSEGLGRAVRVTAEGTARATMRTTR